MMLRIDLMIGLEEISPLLFMNLVIWRMTFILRKFHLEKQFRMWRVIIVTQGILKFMYTH